MKRILVTGGAGYIGSALTRKLLELGYEVVVLDALIFGPASLKQIENNPRLKLINADIRDSAALRSSLTGVDGVIHLAAIANDPSAALDPELTRQINLDVYPALLRESAAAGAGRFINMSSISVYGVNDDDNLTEDDPINPLTEYAVCKARSEMIVRDHHRNTFTTVSLRAGTVCGWSPRMRFDLCANTLAAYAVANKKLTVWGGDQKRPQIHIGDLTDFLVALLTLSADKIGGKTFNAAGQNISVGEVARTIHDVMGGQIELASGPPRADERSYHVSSEKLSRELGLKPKRNVKDAVVEIIDAHKQALWSDPDDSLYHNVKRMVSMELSTVC
jgi:nucleoside-diphosphate-sugar epimerase